METFDIEEQRTILLYYYIGFSIKEISDLTKKSATYIISLLILYFEEVKLKSNFFEIYPWGTKPLKSLFEEGLQEEYKVFLKENG